MSITKKSKYKIIAISCVVFFILFCIYFAYALRSIREAAHIYDLEKFDDNTITLIENEFMFKLPPNSSIKSVRYITSTGRSDILTCMINGDFSEDEFVEKYAYFTVGEIIYGGPFGGSKRITGFSNEHEEASILFTSKDDGTKVLIKKLFLHDKDLLNIIKKEGSEQALP